MNNLSFDNTFSNTAFSNKDVLSVFKKQHTKPTTIQQGMTLEEISDVVSDKIIGLVKQQFAATEKELTSQK